MNIQDRVDKIVKSGLWVRNVISKGRLQYAKLMNMEGHLAIFLVSHALEKPVYSRVEKILVVNNEIIVFYDGEYGFALGKDEYEQYKSYITEKEWQCIFEEDAGEKLEQMGMVSTTDGFYVEAHETMEKYLSYNYDVEASEELCKYFNLNLKNEV